MAMDHDRAAALRGLLHQATVAALGTLHRGEPAVSMVPYALMPGSAELLIHVSRLATHTQDMERHPRVSLMVMGDLAADAPVQARPRVSLAGTATACRPEDPAYAAARAAYLARFPTTAPIFELGDFTLMRVSVASVRFVGGFAQAWSALADDYGAAVSSAP